nr:hypothetical protein [Tanacetum cinerariifolium]
MTLTFADTHNMIAYLTKSDASEGFGQIIDFLNASLIKEYILLPNEEIFTELSRMGYEKPSTKLIFYKNEFSSFMDSAVICLSTGRKFNFSKYIFDSLVRNVDSSTKFYLYPRFLQLMIRPQVGDLSSHAIKYSSLTLTQKQADDVADEGAAGVDVDAVPTIVEPSKPSPTPTTQPPPSSQELPSTSHVLPTPPPSPIAESSSPPQQQPSQPTHDAEILMDLLHTLLETCKTLTKKVKALEQDKVAQALEIIKLKQRVKKEDASKQREIIANIDADKDVTLKDVVAFEKDVEIEENVDVYGRPEEAKPLKKQAQIEQDEAYARELEAELNKNINWDDVIKQVQRKEKEDNVVLRYQALKRKPQTKAQARKNIMIYLRNMAGFKMDYFKGMSYDDIRPIFEKYFNSNKLDEDVEELKKHLQIVPTNDDDVYTEATPLTLKVPVVDYEIHTKNNKPYFKIIRADGTHQLFLSFLSILRNIDREDLEVLWQIVKERLASLIPKNFSDDFLLTTLTYMFEKLNVEAQVWKSQRGVYGLEKVKSWRLLESCRVHVITFTTTQMILLVERRYLLTRFTLDQMLNNV